MAIIRYEQVKEVIIHDANKLSLKEFIIHKIIGGSGTPWALWCDGILLNIFWPADAKTYDEEIAGGKIVVNRLFYAEMHDYTPILSIDTDFGGLKVNVQDVTWSQIYKQIAEWAKAHNGGAVAGGR